MASSRLEKIGTIYSRARGLIETGARRWEDRPLWFDIYESFPPKEEPSFSRPVPNLKLKQIFYQEDKLRALFHKQNKYLGITKIGNTKQKTLTQKFIENYRKIEEKYGESQRDEEKIYREAIELLRREKEMQQDPEKTSPPKIAEMNTENTHNNVDITKIFQ